MKDENLKKNTKSSPDSSAASSYLEGDAGAAGKDSGAKAHARAGKSNGGNGKMHGKEDMGFAGNLARQFLRSPLTLLLLILLLAAGVLGMIVTPREENPQISVPMVDIFVSYPGNSPQEVARMVTDPLQRIMSEIAGVKHVYSYSARGQSMVVVRFKVGEKLGPSLVKVYRKLASNMDKIPPGASQPLIRPKGINDVPIVTFTLWSKTVGEARLYEIGRAVLQKIKQVPDTGLSFIQHGPRDVLSVDVLPDRLAAYGITPQQAANVIRAANTQIQTGRTEWAGKSLSVISGKFLSSPDAVRNLVVGTYQKQPVYLHQVARVRYGPGEVHSLVQYYTGAAAHAADPTAGAPAVTLAVAKTAGSNGVTVASEAIARVKSLEGSVIPNDVHVSITRDYGKTANDKVNELFEKLFEASIVVALLILVTLGWRAAVASTVSVIPAILITVFFAMILGMSINRVSLFAFIFAIGILVDNAIVIVENIYRRWLEEGKTSAYTLVDAVREVGNPTTLATFGVIAALMPMIFVRGMMGPYMAPIPILGSISMLASLFAAFIFAPWLVLKYKPSMDKLERMEKSEHRLQEFLHRFYTRVLTPLIERRWLGRFFLLGIILAFFGSLGFLAFKLVPFKMLPYDNSEYFSVVVNMPAGTALPVTTNVTNEMADVLRKIPEVTALQTYIGTTAPFNFNGMVRHYYLRDKPWQAMINVQLINKHKRHLQSHQIAIRARVLLEPIAKAHHARIVIAEVPPGPPVQAPVVAEIYGPSASARAAVASEVMRAFEKSKNLTDIGTSLEAPHDIWRFSLNRIKAGLTGVQAASVNQSLSLIMGRHQIGDYKPLGQIEQVPIEIQAPLGVRSDIYSLAQLPVPSASGHTVPLYELGTFRMEPAKQPIYQQDLQPVDYVTAGVQGRLSAPLYGMLEAEQHLKGYVCPSGQPIQFNWVEHPANPTHCVIKWGGAWTVTYETFRDMGIAFMVALVLIYMLVVWQFDNYMLPLVIMAPIPLTLIGILPGHWLLNASFTATSMIGFIALAGIIIRNSILLVDYAVNQVHEGVAPVDAIIDACAKRTRPIVITALALALSSYFIITQPIFQGMGVSLLFGVLVSTLLTLLVVPLGLYSARKSMYKVHYPEESDEIGEILAGAAEIEADEVVRESASRDEPSLPDTEAGKAQGDHDQATSGSASEDKEATSAEASSASAEKADPVWRLPLHQPYGKMLKSRFADLVNCASSPYAGAIVAALFLQRFVDDEVDWLHFDMMAWNVSSSPGHPEGGEAMGVRAMFELLRKRYGASPVTRQNSKA